MADTQAELASLDRLDDRLVTTENDKLGALLKVVLPKLILLVNKDALRARVMKMFGSLLKRIKNLPSDECEVPLASLFDLMQRQHLPFACNFAMTFVDVVWETQQSRMHETVALSVLRGLGDWPLYSPQSNALLCYSLSLVPVLGKGMQAYIASGLGEEVRAAHLRQVLGDFYLDVVLARSGIVEGAAGSVQPGLSGPRVSRLTSKKKELSISVLRVAKLAVIEHLTDGTLFEPWMATLISIVLSYDPDTLVAQQASHKMAAYAASTDVTDVDAMQTTLTRLIRLCSAVPKDAISTIDMAGNATVCDVTRSCLRDEVRAGVYRWIFKNAKGGLLHAAKDVVAVFIETFFTATTSGSGGTSPTSSSSSAAAVLGGDQRGSSAANRKIRSAVMGLALGLAESLDNIAFASHANVFFRGCSKVLESFTRLRGGGSGTDNDESMLLRERCYALVEMVGRKSSLVAAEGVHIVAILFRLLDHEDERLSPRLYSCLGVLREVHQQRTALLLSKRVEDQEDEERAAAAAAVDANSDAMDVDGTDAGGSSGSDSAAAAALLPPPPLAQSLGSEDDASLQEVLHSASCSSEPKKRLAALQWSRAVFGWRMATLQAMVLLVDDTAEMVKFLAIKDFGALRAYLKTYAPVVPVAAVTSASADNGNGETAVAVAERGGAEQENQARRVVLEGVLAMLRNPSPALKDPRRARARQELILTAATGLEGLRAAADAAASATSASGTSRDQAMGSSSLAAAAAPSAALEQWGGASGSSSSSSSSGSNRPPPGCERLVDAFPDIFLALRVLPNTNTTGNSSGGYAMAVSSLARAMVLFSGFAEQTLKAVEAVEDMLCTWLGTMDETEGAIVAEVIGLRCLGESVKASNFKLIHAKIADVASATTVAAQSAGLTSTNNKKKMEELLHSERRAKRNVMRALGSIAVATELRLRQKPEAALAESLKPILQHLFTELHTAIDTACAMSASRPDPSICAWATAAAATWTRLAESQLFCNTHTASALSLNRANPVIAKNIVASEGRSAAASNSRSSKVPSVSLTEKMVTILVAFKDIGKAPTSASAASGPGTTTTELGPGRTSHISLSVDATAAASALERGSGGANGSNTAAESQEVLVSAVVRGLSSYCIHSSEATPELSLMLWKLLGSAQLWASQSDVFRFALGECLVRMAYLLGDVKGRAVTDSCTTTHAAATSSIVASAAVEPDRARARRGREAAQAALLQASLPVPMAHLVQMAARLASDEEDGTAVSEATASSGDSVAPAPVPGQSKRGRGTAAALLLVLTKHAGGLSLARQALLQRESSSSDGIESTPVASVTAVQIPYEMLLFLLDCSLSLLKRGDTFTQDVACLSLCHLHALAHSNYSDSAIVGGKTASDRISEEVISALGRERKAPQPVGMSEDASASSSTTTGASGEGANPGTNTGNRQDEPPADAEERRRRERDQLESAAAQVARQAGMNIEEIRGTIETAAAQAAAAGGPGAVLPAWRRRDPDPGSYGVYSTAINVAKKSGDATIVFGVLSLIRRHPSFGATDTPSEEVYRRYRPAIARVPVAKMQTLLPMLFAARFDPYDTVREVMRELWDVLVPAENAHLTILLQSRIMRHLAGMLSSPVWRDREAACVALENFLVRRSWKQVRPRLETLWRGGMRVLDDVRDSTRMASLGLVKVLTDQVLRAANPEDGSPAVVRDCLDTILPLLVDRGLVAPTPEGRGLTLGVLVSLIKVSKSHLGDWLPRLISTLVECMSAMEPQTLQYMSFHTARLKMSEEELDKMRLDMARNSPMQEALDGCLGSLSSEHVPEVLFHLCSSLSHGVGMPSRAAAASSLSYLVEKYPDGLGTHVNRAFGEVINLLVGNPHMQQGLRRTLLSCLGSVGKAVDAAYMEEATRGLIDKYNAPGSDRRSDGAAAVASCLQAIVGRCSHKLADHDVWTLILSVAYVGSFDADEACRTEWASVLSDSLAQSGAGNKTTALQRALAPVLTAIRQCLQDLSWSRREHGLRALQDMLKSVSVPDRELYPYLLPVAETLLRLIRPQIWTGQAQVLETLALLVCKCDSALSVSAEESGQQGLLVRSGQTVLALDDVPAATELGINTTTTTTTATDLDRLAFAAGTGAGAEKGWCLGAEALLALLLKEAGRGEKAYRLAAAIAISELPWKRLARDAPSVGVGSLEMFCAVVGVAPYAAPITDSTDSGSAEVTGVNRGPTEQQKIRALTRPTYTKKSTSSLSLFGGRYVGGGPPKAGGGSGSSGVEEGEVVQLHAPLTTGSIVRIGHTDGNSGNNSPRAGADTSGAAEGGSSSSHAMDVEPNDGDEGGEERDEREQQALMELEREAAVEQGLALSEAAARDARLLSMLEDQEGGGEEEGESEATKKQKTSATGASIVPSSPDPAFRIRFVETLSQAWPVHCNAAPIPSSRSSVMSGSLVTVSADYRDSITTTWLRQTTVACLEWVRTVALQTESWALRRAGLRLVESMMRPIADSSNRDMQTAVATPTLGVMDTQMIETALDAVAAGSADVKHAKVRVAALQTLEALLRRLADTVSTAAGDTNLLRDSVSPLLSSRAQERIRQVIRAAAAESQSETLRRGTELHKLWSSMSSHFVSAKE
jgi:hypothetical protein